MNRRGAMLLSIAIVSVFSVGLTMLVGLAVSAETTTPRVVLP